MIKWIFSFVLLAVSPHALADFKYCAFPMKNGHGLTSTTLADSYFLRIHNILAGELDPNVLGDGGVVVGINSQASTSTQVFVLFENNSLHPFTTKVDQSFRTGWPFLLLKKTCISEIKSRKHIAALYSLVTSHMNVPKSAKILYFIYQ